jgi:hypothetical protein
VVPSYALFATVTVAVTVAAVIDGRQRGRVTSW